MLLLLAIVLIVLLLSGGGYYYYRPAWGPTYGVGGVLLTIFLIAVLGRILGLW